MSQVPTEMQAEPTPAEIKQSRVYQQWGLTQAEYEQICQHLDRLPNYTETGLFAAMWSEHCSYKKSKPVLKRFWSQNDRVIQGPGEGAGVIDIGDGQAVVFKAESHNHPSAVEPYEGAATGVGGILRDIFSMGAQPIAVLDSLRFGEINDNYTKHLVDQVIAGIAGYGNAIGIPTVGGEIAFDDVYKGNPLVNVMAVGTLDQADLHVGKARGTGNKILYVGAATGRDGIHGATFASSDFESETEQDRSAVQVGDPFLEKLVMDATIQAVRQFGSDVVGIQDMGAAGLVSSSAEMAGKAGNGVHLNLDRVPQRETNMTPYELMLSESQERMLLVVKPEALERVAKLFTDAGLSAVEIGTVTDDGRYQLQFHGQTVTDVEVNYLVTPPKQHQAERVPHRLETEDRTQYQPQIEDASATLMQLLGQSTIASKAGLFRHFDSMVRTDTVIRPGGDAALVRVTGTNKGLALTTDISGRYTYLDPEIGGARAVVEAAQNITVTGATPIGLTDCLNFGDPDDPEVYYELDHASQGINTIAQRLNTPIISGNVSLYNETDGQPIYPTPMVGMVGLLQDVHQATTSFVKQAGDLVYLIGTLGPDFNGSELQKLQTGTIHGRLRPVDADRAADLQALVRDQILAGNITAAHDVAEGGLAVTLAEMTFTTPFSLDVQVNCPVAWTFAETPSVFAVAVPVARQAEFERDARNRAQYLGRVTDEATFSLQATDQTIRLDKATMQQHYQEALSWQLNH
ncbi:phosphoribosylformylglycinamidine synthase subunit PurL [Fructilactobacillus cliffordii]|uniref:Phosphoribosylformylglycinamidine synthase subunit PurL n=1 Tax=Fructilactobacillus cliffordii TaxID=2940299 RepID=A0A9Q8ZXG6_9LACO|nr:phosphoribosylformylglycinamidine synthase subunit PurL [Fructilactobacillus cliffordii]USS89311.1 phosphoribosylformylglycinamidine synthase subunit PurL [Fructilactobacillus cliffordii]